MHSCVHSWTTSVLNDDWDYNLSKLALTCVASAVPSTNKDKWWILQRRLMQHVTRYEQLITSGLVNITQMEWALSSFGDLYTDQGKLTEAERMYERALREYEETLGPNHTSTLGTINNLGRLYVDQGKLGDAKNMYERALRGYEEALGPSHTQRFRRSVLRRVNYATVVL